MLSSLDPTRPAIDARPVDSHELGLGGRSKLWLSGRMPDGPRVAIVGARAALTSLRTAVPHLVAAFGELGHSVVSGGARGVDADVHRAALDLGVAQLVVLPCPPDRLYPPEHAPLFRAIASPHGGVLCCQPPGAEPCRGVFASRNRWVVAAADAVVVVQAEIRSGSRTTGDLALRRRLPVAVVAGSRGAAALAAAGASVLQWDPDAPARLVQAATAWRRGDAPETGRPWPDDLRPILERLREAGPAGLCAQALGGRLDLLCRLTIAEAQGFAVEVHPGRFVLASP